MDCPNCQQQLTINRRITGNFFSDWFLGEILFVAIILPLMFLGPLGWAFIALLVLATVFASWGKQRFKCKHCGYKTTIKVDSEYD